MVRPAWVVPGGHVRIDGLDLPQGDSPPSVTLGGLAIHTRGASQHHVSVILPSTAPHGSQVLRLQPGDVDVGTVTVARSLATELHQVDSPAFDGLGRLFATNSGSRGTSAPVGLYRVSSDGRREPITVALPNPTSLAMGPDGAMYVSSRFEGTVYRLLADDRAELYVGELGVPTGLAFGADGALFVGDRSGSIFRVRPGKQIELFATIPSSVAAFHLAFGPDGCLYVTAPTLASRDPIYRISPERLVDTFVEGFGRPQGLAFDSEGRLYVVEALAGASGLYRLDITRPEPELVATAAGLIGVAFDPNGGMVLASHDTLWRLDVPLRPLAPAFHDSPAAG